MLWTTLIAAGVAGLSPWKTMWNGWARSLCSDKKMQNITKKAPVDYWQNALNLGYSTSDGYSHFRICEGNTAEFECYNSKTLHLGGCWYGAPFGDGGYGLCTNNGNCNLVVGNCLSYIGNACNGKDTCSVTANNANMGGDPCVGTHKYVAAALKCQWTSFVFEQGWIFGWWCIEFSSKNLNLSWIIINWVCSFSLGCWDGPSWHGRSGTRWVQQNLVKMKSFYSIFAFFS